MDFGAVLQTNPPAARTVALAQLAEQHGFNHVWTFDSPLLWQEPYVLFSRILDHTSRIRVGPMVTNPRTREPTVTASLFATLNEMYGNRTVCGIGRGDSSVRVTNSAPTTVQTLREAIPVIRNLANASTVSYHDVTLQFPWSTDSRLDVWVAAYGPKVLRLAGELGDGFILQLGDVNLAEWMIEHVRTAAEEAGRDPDAIKICVAAPMYVTDGSSDSLSHARDQCRWFGGMVGNHVADIVDRYGGSGKAVPSELTDYIKARQGYDYNEHGQAGNAHTEFINDEIVDRFCVVGTVDDHIAKLTRLKTLGVTQFAGYLQHDNKDETLRAYGEHIIPAIQDRPAARS